MIKNKSNILITILFIIIAVIFTVLVKYVDVKNIGPNDSAVGFAKLNEFVQSKLGTSMSWYNITKYLALLPIAAVGIYAIMGMIEAIRKKSIFKVRKELIMLGVFLVLVVGVYAFFEICIVNYRPILMEGELEASYPSSHTMLTICICIGICILNSKAYNNKLTKIVNTLLLAIMAVVVIGRMLSGVHWITDIIGGILISASLIMAYYTAICQWGRRKLTRIKSQSKSHCHIWSMSFNCKK